VVLLFAKGSWKGYKLTESNIYEVHFLMKEKLNWYFIVVFGNIRAILLLSNTSMLFWMPVETIKQISVLQLNL
jgi:hypothetical protein